MEYSAFGKDSLRKGSNLSDIDLTDHEHCLLCYNQLRVFSLGKCNHKNICHICALRLRIIMKDKQCPICKTECDEIVIAED